MGASGSFWSGALTGAAGSAVGSLTGLIPGIQTNGWGTAVQVGTSAAFGGIVSELSGGNFWNGAAQAGIIAGFNHAAHRMLEDDGPGKKKSTNINKGTENGKNYFGDRYTGPYNPDGYSLSPLNERDAISMQHDQAYDMFKAVGFKGVLENGYVWPADARFTIDQMKLSVQLFSRGYSLPITSTAFRIYVGESLKSFAAGTFMGVFTTPKALIRNPYNPNSPFKY